MISKNRISFINSLKQKKFRQQHGLYIAEGSKIIPHIIRMGASPESIYFTSDADISSLNIERSKLHEISPVELKKISSLETPNQMLGVFHIAEMKDIDLTADEVSLVLDDIRDPGNLGTLIRLAHWYGIKNIYCSRDTVDMYNPKVIQSAMGSHPAVNVHYCSLAGLIQDALNRSIQVYCATMKGNDYKEISLNKSSMIVMGSESHGISDSILNLTGIVPITIAPFNPSDAPESLNVSIAAAIILASVR